MVNVTFPFNLTFDGIKFNHSNFKQTRSELAQFTKMYANTTMIIIYDYEPTDNKEAF